MKPSYPLIPLRPSSIWDNREENRFKLNGVALEHVNAYDYLGIMLDKKMALCFLK